MVEEAQRLSGYMREGEVRDVAADMSQLALRVVSRALFGAELDEDALEISHAVAEAGEFFDYLTVALLPVLLRTPLPRVRRFKDAIRLLERETARVITERRDDGEERDDLLAILLAARDVEGDGTGMSDEQVRDEALTLITAGHETTANGLTWTWYELAQHPAVEARFHEELAAVVGDRPLEPDDLSALPYTQAVLLESMRLYPPAWALGRRAIEDVPLGDGLVVPRDSLVLLSQWVTHRDPRFWDGAEEYRPERWSEDARAIFAELGLDEERPVWRSLLESERFRRLLAEPPVLAAAA
jgi:cytochrome P450